jgi:hypothetical protein
MKTIPKVVSTYYFRAKVHVQKLDIFLRYWRCLVTVPQIENDPRISVIAT